MGGGKKQTTTTNQTRNPYAPAQPALQQILDKSGQLADQTHLFERPVSQQTDAALNQLEALGHQGSAAVGPLQNLVHQTGQGADVGFGELIGTAQGQNLNGNPFFNEALEHQLNDVRDRVNREYSAAGRFGSNAHTEGLTKRLGELSVNAHLDNYNRERGYQMTAADRLANFGFAGADAAGQLDHANAYGANLLGQVGEARDQIESANRQAPLNALQYQAGLTTPIASLGSESSGTQTTKQPSDKFGQLLGGGLAIAGLATGNPALVGMSGFGGLTGPGKQVHGAGQPFFGLFGGGQDVALNPWTSVVTPYA